MRPPSTARPALWVGLGAAVVRLAYFAEHARSAFFGVAILDEAYYDGLARALLGAGDPAAFDLGFRPLLYPLFLAAVYRLAALAGAFDVALAIAAQHLLGVATAVLVVFTAGRLLRSAAGGALAGALYVLAGPPLYFEGELLITSLFTFLIVLLLWSLGRLDGPQGDRLGGWLLAGAIAGLATQARANLLPFLAAFPLAALWQERRASTPRMRRAATLAGAALATALAVQLAFAAFGASLGGPFSLLPSAGGINLYLGNERGADGMNPRQDRPVTYGERYRDSVQVFALEEYRAAQRRAGAGEPIADSPRQVSRYWLGRAWHEVRAEPLAWARLMTRKVLFLLGDREIPNNKSYDFVVTHESPLLGLLPVRWWLLLALAPLGVAFAARRGDRALLGWLLAFVALHALGVIAFFVTSRYRIPLWPPLAMLAAGGLLWLVARARRRAWAALAGGLAVVAAGAAVALAPAPRVPESSFARDYFFRSIANFEKGRLDDAESDARASLALDSSDGAAWLQWGDTLRAQGRTAEAIRVYRRAAQLLPGEPRIANNLGVALEELGRPRDGYTAYLRALALLPDFPPALVNAALLELRAGRLDDAAERLARARALGFDSPSMRCALALLARARGDQARFEREIAAVRAEHPEAVARILADQAEPLALPEVAER